MPALCGNGAKKLLERKACLELMVQSMSNSDLHSVKMEGFKLAGCFSVMILTRNFSNVV